MGKEAALSPWQKETGSGLEPFTSCVPLEKEPLEGQAFLCRMGAEDSQGCLETQMRDCEGVL